MDIKGDWKKRAVSGLMVLAMALSLLPTSILAADTRSVTDNAIKNGSFEQPESNELNSPQLHADLVFGWDTTASDHLIEFGSRRNKKDAPQLTGNNKKIPDGDQFAELNADEESTLYQYATTVDGNVYEWGLSHRGRYGIDQMAVIIGPKQNVDPAKPSKDGKDGRDQFMRMTDWVRQNASNLKVAIPQTGCTQKITVYSKKFAANGGFQNDIGDSAFSASPSDVYTEKWNVWIIGTNSDAWDNYGTNSPAYAAGKLAYSCRYAVPDGQTETVFAFCSYSAAGGINTCGNLIDNIYFDLFQTLSIRASGGGTGSMTVSADGKGSTIKVSDSETKEAVVADGSNITVQAVKPKDSNVQFVGAYVTRRTAKGLEQVFIPVADKGWREEGDTYTYQHHVEEPADIVLVFIKSPTVVYDANGGQEYVYEHDATEPKNTVSFAEDTGRTKYTSHAAQAPAGCEDTWQFQGWLLVRSKTLLPADHTVSYDAASETFTFAANDETTELKSSGATLIAQWKWRQRFVTASRVKGPDGTASDDFQVNADCGTVSVSGGVCASDNLAVTDYFASDNELVTATATAKEGYCFIGWYQQVDGNKYELVSSEPTHSYNVSREGVQTIYARFAPTHTVTYQWTKTQNECPTDKELEAAGKTLPAAATVMDGDNYPISTVYKADETSIPGTKQENGVTVYGEWTFSGWRDEQNQIREVNLVNIRGNRTLTGYWTFEPNTKFTLTYQVAEDGIWTPSNLSALAAAKQYFRTEPVTAANAPTYTQDELYVDQNLTLKGTWTFGGWKRSDTGAIISATTGSFNMPDRDLTLTGQWSFVPDTYTVSYDLNGGAGTAPLPHDSYDYSALAKKSGCDTTQRGIPFGASITLQALPDDVQVPKGTYFAGWGLSRDAQQTQQPGDRVNEKTLGVPQDGQQVTLYAIYKSLAEITVEFTVNNPSWGTVTTHSGTFYVNQDQATIMGDAVTSQAVAAAGFHFTGWVNEDGESAGTNTDLTVSAGNLNVGQEGSIVRYIAQFAPNTFTIQYNANYPEDAGDKSGKMADQTFSAADTSRNLSQNQFQCKGYTFDGWTTQSDGSGDFYSDGAAFTQTVENEGEVTLYAKWERLPDVTITYTAFPDSLGRVTLNSKVPADINTQDAAAPDTQSGIVYETLNPETGTPLGATATPNAGSVFVGWYDRANGQNADPVGTDTAFTPRKSGDRYVGASYVARFRPYRYTLAFDANGGVGEMAAQTFGPGQYLPLNECFFSREGYDFVGWALSEDGKKQFSDKAEVQFTDLVSSGSKPKDGDSATLYAVWREQRVTIGYVSSDAELGTVTVGSETIGAVNGTSDGSIAQPKSGARFDGWYSADGTLLSTELKFVPTRVDGTVWQGTTYYAHFSAKRSPSTPSTPAKPGETKPTLAPIPEMLNGEDHYAYLLGYEDGTVRPNGSISRAEVATVLFRLLKDCAHAEFDEGQRLQRCVGYCVVRRGGVHALEDGRHQRLSRRHVPPERTHHARGIRRDDRAL